MVFVSVLAFLLGAGLGVVAGFVLGAVLSPPAATPARPTPRLECVCGRSFAVEQDAKEHAIDAHGAIDEAGMWRDLMEETA